MRKILILTVLVVGLFPNIKKGKLTFSNQIAYSQDMGDEECYSDDAFNHYPVECDYCDTSSPDYDVAQCEDAACDENSASYDPDACENSQCSEFSANYDPAACESQACDPYSTNYDPVTCDESGGGCDESAPSYDPASCDYDGGGSGGGDGGGSTGGGSASDPDDAPADIGDPCANFINWVNNHNKGSSGTYYDNSKSLTYNLPQTSCQSGSWNCPSGARYWYIDGDQKFYYYSGWKEYKECGQACRPLSYVISNPINTTFGSIPTATSPEEGWCVFISTSALGGGTACSHATVYYANYRASLNISGCNSALGVKPAHVHSFVGSRIGNAGLTFDWTDVCSLTAFFEAGHKFMCFTSIGGVTIDHALAAYGIQKFKNGTYEVIVYDPEIMARRNYSVSDIFNGGIITVN